MQASYTSKLMSCIYKPQTAEKISSKDQQALARASVSALALGFEFNPISYISLQSGRKPVHQTLAWVVASVWVN
jgi:hypothetical protein